MKKFISTTLFFTLILPLITYAKTLVYAHRGGRALWPENTLYAYQQSLKLAVDFVDMDVQLSKDGVLMVTHDKTLNPVLTKESNGNWLTAKIYINQLTAQELKQYNVGQIKPNTEYARQYADQIKQPNLKIPTLIETIQFVKAHQKKTTGFQIEIKMDQADLNNLALAKRYARKINEVLIKQNLIEQAEVQSFNFRVLIELYKLNPKIKLAFLTAADHPFPLWSAGHSLEKNQHVTDLIRRLHGTFWEPAAYEVSHQDVIKAHNNGLKVVVWGLPWQKQKEIVMIKKLLRFGVDGIITDRPDLIKLIQSNSF